jgi:hypothetical protein
MAWLQRSRCGRRTFTLQQLGDGAGVQRLAGPVEEDAQGGEGIPVQGKTSPLVLRMSCHRRGQFVLGCPVFHAPLAAAAHHQR